MTQELKPSLLTPGSYYTYGYGGYCPQHYQQVNRYGSTTYSVLPFISKPLIQRTVELPKLQRTSVNYISMSKETVTHDVYIPPGYSGHLPMLQFQNGNSWSHTAAYSTEFQGIQSSRREQKPYPIKLTYNDGSIMNINPYRRGPMVESDSKLTTFIKPPTIQLPHLQRNAIPGYTGFIPRYGWSIGVNYVPAVKACMNEFDRSQIQIRYPWMNSEQRLKPSYWPYKIYSPAGLLPKYTGFVPGLRDNYGYTYGNSTRQLYWRYPL